MVLSLATSGCVTVHGELAVVPSASRSEAAQALKEFTDAYNASDKAYDAKLDAGRVTGAFGAINQAGLTSRAVTSPNGNPGHQDLELTDAKFTIPKKAGWPRWFVADTDSNRDAESGPGDNTWLLVFVRNGPEEAWKVAYLTIVSPRSVPEFKTDNDGWAQAVSPDSDALAVAPEDLSTEYASYLKTGEPAHFAPGPHTDAWRASREKDARRPGLTTQYIDQPVSDGDFAPLALATKDGGAMAFFATRFFDRQTAAKGYRPKVDPDVRALLTGEVKNTLTREWVSSQTVVVPAPGKVAVVGRLQGVVAAKGS
ncbi:hypothetical protein [Streptomyces sp. NPDC088725]|uniref:hypothetical protein n=1 Tax=Streptomyces sp. NPDC088725 TaxID=3365873 RepID=UPI0038004338